MAEQDIATLGLKIDASGAVKATEALNSLAAAGKKAEQATEGVANASKQMSAAQDRAAQVAKINAEGERRYAAEQAKRARDAQVKAAENGRNEALARLKAMEREYRSDTAQIKEAAARGLLTPQEAAEAGRISAEAYNRATLEVLSRGQASGAFKGAAGQEAYVQIAGSIKNVGEESRRAGIGVASLRGPLTTLTSQALAMNPALGTFGSMLGSFALGSGLMIGVLGGLAALALAWEKITENTRESRQAFEDALTALESYNRGWMSSTAGDVPNQLREVEQNRDRIAADRDRAAAAVEAAMRGGGGEIFLLKAQQDLTAKDAELAEAERQVANTRAGIGRQVAEDHRRMEEEQDRHLKEQQRQQDERRRQLNEEAELMRMLEAIRIANSTPFMMRLLNPQIRDAFINSQLRDVAPSIATAGSGINLTPVTGHDGRSGAERALAHQEMVRQLEEDANAAQLAAVYNLLDAVGSLSKEAQRGARGLAALVNSIQMIQSGRGAGGITGALNIASGAIGGISALLQLGDAILGQSQVDQERNDIMRENNERLRDLRLEFAGFKLTEENLDAARNASRSLAAEVSAALKKPVDANRALREELAGRNPFDPLTFRGDAKDDERVLRKFVEPYGLTFEEFSKIVEKSGVELFDSTGNVIVPALQQVAEALGLMKIETDAVTRSLANVPDLAPVALWRSRTANGVGATSTSGGAALVVNGDITVNTTATDGKTIFMDVRRAAVQDIRMGGNGFREAV